MHFLETASCLTSCIYYFLFFLSNPASPAISTLSLHDALPIFDLYVAFVIAGADEFDDGPAAEDELLAALVPRGADGDDRCVRAKRERGDAGGRASEVAEEGDEDALALLRVEVGQDSERAALFEQAQGR